MNKKILGILVLFLTLVFSGTALASLTFTTDAITGTTASTIDLGAGNNLLLQTSGGIVGIGTASPEGNFTVNGNSASVFISERAFGNAIAVASRLVGLSSTDNVTTNFGASLSFSLEDSAGVRLNNTGALANVWENAVSPNRAAALYFSTLSPGSSANTEKMRITGAGNVGIGTKTPGSKLSVVGLPVYANNAAALAGGLVAGDFYHTGGDPDLVAVVH